MMTDQIGDIVVKGHKVTPDLLQRALSSLPDPFGKADFRQVLLDAGWQQASDPELVRLLMQALKWRGIMSFDKSTNCWQLSEDDTVLPTEKTLPLLTVEPDLPLLFEESGPAHAAWDRRLAAARL